MRSTAAQKAARAAAVNRWLRNHARHAMIREARAADYAARAAAARARFEAQPSTTAEVQS